MRLFKIVAYPGEVSLHGGGVAGGDYVAEFRQLLLYAGELLGGVGVEEYLRQQIIVFRHQSSRNGHVALEGSAWCILMAHDACKHEGRCKRY